MLILETRNWKLAEDPAKRGNWMCKGIAYSKIDLLITTYLIDLIN